MHFLAKGETAYIHLFYSATLYQAWSRGMRRRDADRTPGADR
jgi:hypothetical protein